MGKLTKEFNDYRKKMNAALLDSDNLVMKRLFNIDSQSYDEGALSAKTKEMLGLVASLVLRCDDCIRYHLIQCHDLGLNRKELFEVLSIAQVVGGSIVIPHSRRALEFWDDIEQTA